MFLAALPPAEVTRLFERRLLVGTYDEHTLDSYVAELDRVAEQGFAVNDGRTSVEEVGVSAPVRDHRGVVVAAVHAVGTTVPGASGDARRAGPQRGRHGRRGLRPARGRDSSLEG